jgi:hypothetical protein
VSDNDPGPAQPGPARPAGVNRQAIAALVVVGLLVLVGLWLSHVLGAAGSLQDCVAQGRTNCAPASGN